MAVETDYKSGQTGPITNVTQLAHGVYFPAAIWPNAEQNKDTKYENEMDKYTPVVLIASSDLPGAASQAQQIKQMKMALSRGFVLTATILAEKTWADSNVLIVTNSSSPCDNSMTRKEEVSILGYGKKSESDVWIVRPERNVTGGENGYFYFKMNENPLCLESKLVTFIVPKYYDEEEGLVTRGTRNSNNGLQKDTGSMCDNNNKYLYMSGNTFSCV